ncbi:MAG: sulfatase [Planctomycetota bacterium]
MRWMVSVLTGLVCVALTAASMAEPQRRHVLFIAVDDLRPELGCYGAAHIHSPNIDRLAAEEVRFDRAYTPMAICMSARVGLMSGYGPLTGRMYNRGPMSEHVPDALSMNQHFMNQGYETVTIGKIYHHASDEATGWTRNFRSIEGGWGQRGYVEEASLAVEIPRAEQGLKGPPFESADVGDDGYPTGAFAQRAIEELRGIGDKPLFLALGFRKPHLPFNAPQKYWDLYDPEEIELSVYPSEPINAPSEATSRWGELRTYAGIPTEGPVNEEMARQLIHGYYACISYVDAQIGRVLDEVDRLGLRDEIVVVLWSDHGWKLGDYDMWCKYTNYEIDMRIPLIFRSPGMAAAGRTTDALVDLQDLYPTLCALAGIETPGHVEGESLVPLLDDAEAEWRRAVYGIWARRSADKERGFIGYTMRTERYRYTEWRRTHGDALLSRELYDHVAGPLVSENVVDAPEHAAMMSELAVMLRGGHGKDWALE